MVKLVRLPDLEERTNKLRRRVFDTPEYKFFFGSDFYWDLKEDGAWVVDAFAILSGGNYVGTITWKIDRGKDLVYEVSIMMAPEFLNTGIGVAALVLWIDYQINQRNVRKMTFTCIEGNSRAKKIYDKMLECGALYVGFQREQLKLADNKYHGLHIYELIGREFIASEIFKRVLDWANRERHRVVEEGEASAV